MLIMAAPNGARKNKSDHPKLPLSIAETVETAVACFAEGAEALHLHVRGANGEHSLDTGLYREALAALDSAVPEMRVQVTTESAGVFSAKDQLSCLKKLAPTWATIALREAASGDTEHETIGRQIYETCVENGTEIQHILYDPSDISLLRLRQDQGLIDQNASVLLVLGRYSKDMNSSVEDLEPFLEALPEVGKWMLCAFGPNEHLCLRKAASLGGDVRVGFENSHQKNDGQLWSDMAASVRALKASLALDGA